MSNRGCVHAYLCMHVCVSVCVCCAISQKEKNRNAKIIVMDSRFPWDLGSSGNTLKILSGHLQNTRNLGQRNFKTCRIVSHVYRNQQKRQKTYKKKIIKHY